MLMMVCWQVYVTLYNFKIWGVTDRAQEDNRPVRISHIASIWKLGNYTSDIKWNLYIWYKLRYVLIQHLSFIKKWCCQPGGKKERGHPKIPGKSLIKILGYLEITLYKSTKNVT